MRELLARIFARRQTQPPRHEHGHVLAFPMRAEAGIAVTEDIALQNDVANACGSLIARSIAMLPCHVLAPRSDDDGNQRLTDHPVELMLQRQANAEMTAFTAKEGLVLSAIFHGNGYAEIEWDQTNRPLALWPIHSPRVEVCRDNGRLVYEVDGGADRGGVDLDPANVFHLRGPSMCGVIGMSLISYARHSIGLATAQQRYASNFIRNQAAPSGMVKIKTPISEPGFALLKQQFEHLNAGPRKAGKVLFGDGDWEWQQISVSPQDAEFLAQCRFSVETICRWFGVPPQMVGSQEKMTFANFEQAGLNFLTLAVLPWVTRFEQEINRKLLTRSNGAGVWPFLKINTAAIVRANLEAQYRAFSLGRQWGWLSVNDIRKLCDLEPIGPEGDEYLRPMNMQPVGESPPDENSQADEDQRRAGSLRRVK